VVTQKGRGYQPAEGEPVAFHGVSPFDPLTGELSAGGGGVSYTGVFGDWVCDAAESDGRLWAITPAMREGSGLVGFSERFPDRFSDVGIAEQHALTLAAGMACEGLKPVVAIYSTFLQRAYDQLIHDIALQNLDVTFAVDRAGQVGADGATHAGSFDLSYARAIPNMVVMAPADEAECRRLLQTAFEHPGPALVRYPRGKGPGADVPTGLEALPIGKGEVRRRGSGAALLAFGTMVAPALGAAENLDATVADMRFVKPLDEELVARLASEHDLLVTIEENVVQGGAGAGVGECLARLGLNVPVLHLGLPDAFIEQATQAEQLALCGLSAEGIEASVRGWLARHS
jgi:1-deoxy-D-xylulose-5-phosphate synthase